MLTKIKTTITALLVITILAICLCGVAQAEEKDEMAELLFVQNSHDVSIEKGKLTLKKVGTTTIFFHRLPETYCRAHDDKRFCRRVG